MALESYGRRHFATDVLYFLQYFQAPLRKTAKGYVSRLQQSVQN